LGGLRGGKFRWGILLGDRGDGAAEGKTTEGRPAKPARTRQDKFGQIWGASAGAKKVQRAGGQTYHASARNEGRRC